MNLFILPGNPPAVHFYELWASELRERHPEAQIQVARYPLLADTKDSQEYFAQLIEVLSEQLLEFRRRTGELPSLVGHSLGGYLSLKLLEKCPADVSLCYLLHPFLRQPMLRGRVLLKLAHELRRISSLETWLLRVRPLVGVFLPEAHQLTAQEIHVFTQLAYHEHLSIAQDRSPFDMAPEALARLRVYSTRGDIWCPPKTVATLGPEVRHLCGPASHNFIVKRSERDVVYEFLRSI